MNSYEKIAYLKGLAEGVGLEPTDKADKVILAIIDALEVIVDELAEFEADSLELAVELDLLSDSVAALEDICDELDEEDSSCCDSKSHSKNCSGRYSWDFDIDDDDDCDCGEDHSESGHHHDDDDDCDCEECNSELLLYSVTCPACNNEITVDSDILELGAIACPNCAEMLEFDIEEE